MIIRFIKWIFNIEFEDVQFRYHDQNGHPLSFGRIIFSRISPKEVLVMPKEILGGITLGDKGQIPITEQYFIVGPTLIEVLDSDGDLIMSYEADTDGPARKVW